MIGPPNRGPPGQTVPAEARPTWSRHPTWLAAAWKHWPAGHGAQHRHPRRHHGTGPSPDESRRPSPRPAPPGIALGIAIRTGATRLDCPAVSPRAVRRAVSLHCHRLSTVRAEGPWRRGGPRKALPRRAGGTANAWLVVRLALGIAIRPCRSPCQASAATTGIPDCPQQRHPTSSWQARNPTPSAWTCCPTGHSVRTGATARVPAAQAVLFAVPVVATATASRVSARGCPIWSCG